MGDLQISSRNMHELVFLAT